MNNILTEKTVRCSSCDQLLKILNTRQLAARQVKCPKCGETIFINFVEDDISPVSEPHAASATNEDETSHTIYTKEGGSGSDDSPSSPTPYFEFGGQKYPIEKSRSVIGRKASTSNADIQFETSDLYMGRHHALVNKLTDYAGNSVCTIKCYEAKNGITVNDIPLSPSDEINLLDGARVRMGRSVVVFRK